MSGDLTKLTHDAGGSIRLDLPDAESLQTLVYEHMSRMFGAFVGALSNGVLSGIAWDTSGGVGAVTPSHGTIVRAYSEAGGADLPGATIARYDPTQAWQGSISLDFTTYAGPASKPFVWAKLVEVDADSDSRRYYSGGESSGSNKTRKRQSVTMEVNPSSPGADYFIIAQVTGWSGGLPVLRNRSPFGWSAFDGAADNRDVRDSLVPLDTQSVAETLRWVVWVLAYMQARDLSLPWDDYTSVSRGLKELDADLGTAEGDITTIASDVAAAEADILTNQTSISTLVNKTQAVVLLTMRVDPAGTVDDHKAYGGASVSVSWSAGALSGKILTVTIPTSWRVVSVVPSVEYGTNKNPTYNRPQVYYRQDPSLDTIKIHFDEWDDADFAFANVTLFGYVV